MKPNVPLFTPSKSVLAQNAYQTPTSLESNGFLAVNQSKPSSTADQGSIKQKASNFVPSDAANDTPTFDRERGLRKSRYSMRPRSKVYNELDDEDDEDDDRDAQVARRLQAEEFAQVPADVLPSNIARRSTRLAKATSDQAATKRKAVIPPSLDIAEIFKKPRLSQAESDDGSVYADSGDEPADDIEDDQPLDLADDEEPKPITGDAIFTDDDGLIHVGAPDIKVHVPEIMSATVRHAMDRVTRKLAQLKCTTDIKRVGIDADTVKRTMDLIKLEVETSFIPQGEGMIKRYCDYTGLQMVWSLSPRSPSVEAFYAYTIFDGRVHYHAPPNVGIIARTLNWTKGDSIPLMLPLAAAWLLNLDQDDFKVRLSTGQWIMTALCNLAVLSGVLKTHTSHKSQVAEVSSWSRGKQRIVLQACRTGQKSDFVDDLLTEAQADKTPRQLLLRSDTPTCSISGSYSRTLQEWDTIYLNLVKIAQQYGLSESEFEALCTIRRPKGKNRVFFPYHHMARRQALTIEWDWHILRCVAQRTLEGMRAYCNRLAERAGLGEPQVDAVIYIYWICHHLCDNIRKVKTERPQADNDEISFHILDRWGLPIVPWQCHPFKASLCKKQCHGIAMKFGIVKFDNFDPVHDIDLEQATVTIDSKFTNYAMGAFEPDSWDSIRESIRSVPLNSPLWRPDSDLGLEDWIVPARTRTATSMPIAEFDLPLLPIELWVPKDDATSYSPLTVQCPSCLKQFNSIGALIHHCRHQLCSSITESEQDTSVQDAIDQEYWENHWKCPECHKSFHNSQSLLSHMSSHQSERPHKCETEGCDAAFKTKQELRKHSVVHNDDRPYKCLVKDCGASFKLAQALTRHKATHDEDRLYVCDVDNCGKKFKRADHLANHKKSHDPDRPRPHKCGIEGCGKAYREKYDLNYHMRTTHKQS